MIRMEIALFLVLTFVAFVYFSAGQKHSRLHQTFSILLIAVLVHLVFDAVTVYTVNHLDTVPRILNDIFHRFFIGTMVFVVYLFYQYIAVLVEEETGKPRRFDLVAKIYLAAGELRAMLLPVHYAVTEKGNYSDGIHASVCYVSTAFYLLCCVWLLFCHWNQIDGKKKKAIGAALVIEVCVSLLQAVNPTWLISGMGMTLMTMAFYLTLENPDILRAELTEQKMSMLYLKSQVNPHFLYNTLDTIRIQAQLNDDKKVADLLMRLVDDEIMIREGFKRLFDWEGHDCEVLGEAADGMEALARIDTFCPDIVIMDINIPIMNGLKVIQLSRIKHPGIAFVIVSGYDDFSYCQQALRLQITDYILKPVDYEEFGICIDNLKILLYEKRVSEEGKAGVKNERVITGITRYMQEHLAEEVSLSVLSEEFHLNPQYISQLFKNEIGVGFLSYLTNIRMEKAKKLLVSTQLSMVEIAEQTGYGDYRVFTKVFKKTEGITPSQYRREFLEER